ncbi:RNA-directed DNA polymerase [Sporosarcina sp. P29]|uniref:RNA-directed DNA polymerase n=1 Tax=Sporosarcina sp. P29 TaxID=2048252 RepID=UPI000C1739CE|nr:RNA-directed DNA polymerase [Sporosarcina sp. P29]PIC99610.1 hypothetical protein CSV68_07655 [Sporosarcina sp. P29]
MKKIPRLNKIKDGNRLYYNPNDDEKRIYLKIKREIEQKYASGSSNRDQIIKQLISTLTHGDYTDYSVQDIDLFIVRSDIKNFYPSINKHYLYKKLMKANMLSNSTIQTLKPMFFSSSVSGIPLGLPFSSALAEVYLEKFDDDIRQNFNPTFYFRYVDDIIIINYDTIKGIDIEETNKVLEKIFKENFLNINREKTIFNRYEALSRNSEELCFDYLGYKFNTNNKNLHISISENKYIKIINRIKKYFYIFKKSNRSEKQFWLLYYRLMNSLFGIKSTDENGKNMYFGLGYNYKFINDKTQMENFISVVKGLIHSCKLSSKRKSALLYLVFTNGNSLDILGKRYDYTRLTLKQINKIKLRLQITSSDMNISKIFYVIYKNAK